MTEPGSTNKSFHNRQNPEPRRTREDELRQMLADLEREYRERAKPIIDALVEIESMKPPKPVWIDMMQLGTGILRTMSDGTVEHIDRKDWLSEPDGWTTIYFSFPRKGYWPPAIESHGLDTWEQTHRERFNYIECEIWRKRTSDLTPEDMEIAARYGDIPEEWAHPDRVGPPRK